MKDYVPMGIFCECPVCSKYTLQLWRTKWPGLSPWWEGCYHHFYGAICTSCGSEVEAVFVDGGDHDTQLNQCAKELAARAEKRKVNEQ